MKDRLTCEGWIYLQREKRQVLGERTQDSLQSPTGEGKYINVLLNCTKNGLISIQSNFTLVSSHRQV